MELSERDLLVQLKTQMVDLRAQDIPTILERINVIDECFQRTDKQTSVNRADIKSLWKVSWGIIIILLLLIGGFVGVNIIGV